MKSRQSMNSTGLRPWWQNRFWLVLPLLLVNAAVAPLLPAAYQPEVFSAAVLFTAVHTLHAGLVWFGTGGLTTLGS